VLVGDLRLNNLLLVLISAKINFVIMICNFFTALHSLLKGVILVASASPLRHAGNIVVDLLSIRCILPDALMLLLLFNWNEFSFVHQARVV